VRGLDAREARLEAWRGSGAAGLGRGTVAAR
jgi:hypothetical protein